MKTPQRWPMKMLQQMAFGPVPELANYYAPSVKRDAKRKRSKRTPNTPHRAIRGRYPIRRGSHEYEVIVNGNAVKKKAPVVTFIDGRQYAARKDGWRLVGQAGVR